jgi:hypothetical protein
MRPVALAVTAAPEKQPQYLQRLVSPVCLQAAAPAAVALLLELLAQAVAVLVQQVAVLAAQQQ